MPFSDAFTEAAGVEQLLLAGCLGVLERRLGVSQQCLRVAAVDRKHRNAGGGGNPRLVTVDHEWRVPAALPPLFHRSRYVAFIADVLDDGGKVFAADAPDLVGVADAGGETLADLAQ